MEGRVGGRVEIRVESLLKQEWLCGFGPSPGDAGVCLQSVARSCRSRRLCGARWQPEAPSPEMKKILFCRTERGQLPLAALDPSSISRTLQGFLSGIGFLGGAVIFKSGFDVKGIKAAAAIWITGALGLAIATSYWWLGITVGLVTAAVMFVADSFPDEVREVKQETPNAASHAKK
jgi:hypothetical protein